MSRAVSRSSLVSRLVLPLGFLACLVIFYLNQGSVVESLLDRFVTRLKEAARDLPQGRQFFMVNVFALVFCKAKQENRTMRTKADQQAKASSLALARSRDTLLDDAATQVRLDETTRGPINGIDQTFVRDAIFAGEFRKCFGFENPHQRLYRSMYYSL